MGQSLGIITARPPATSLGDAPAPAKHAINSGVEEVKLAITVDVEEEGLFRGAYPRRPDPPRSVAELGRLEPLVDSHGLKLTLLATYPVVSDPACAKVLVHWRENLGAEIGAHLHPWNTPPFVRDQGPEPHLTREIPISLMNQKLATLLAAMEQNLGVTARSFRMGRFDLTPEILALLPPAGISVDSSMVPLRHVAGMHSWFLSPRDPHAPAGAPGLREVPLTMAEVIPGSAHAAAGLGKSLPGSLGGRLLTGFRSWGAAGPQPTMYSLGAMRLGAGRHLARGGRALTMYLHSSELLPGATPNCPDEAGVERLLAKLDRFLGWLRGRTPLRPCTLAEM